ncbi:hypothetical protein QQS21_001249 [Conoideocrella luteorostrata]|uniref:Uncharacterized protein n=1 Tax=Conoideocrella luteorostrata TaxID=1105319 RepID=A0AAJ0CXH4_9HYPO|nr:hypothetical protein QQS21_001249 [Conoideocrella luteorostrata]
MLTRTAALLRTPTLLMRTAHPRAFHTSPVAAIDEATKRSAEEAGEIITGGGEGTKGRTAGGKDLHSTAPGAPGKPKVSNFSTPGEPGEDKKLTKEQQREVDEHNREFEKTHGRVEGSKGG